ncbi:MAG: 50S ribosomal protein L28 [SAR86 cluster bacterium]|jgi:large subunit ribosomal protein L28|nr:MAG: 50S ribosomal protein L28 [SAR86 cluster bacterium]|tara:strand:- start:53 stop:289 length:237 start_codon:yes stop_codon:yes gene_type:complete
MSKVCQVTGKKAMVGNHVSHAKNRVKRLFKPNLHKHKFWVESEKKFITLTVSAKGMRIIDKNGIDNVLKDLKTKGLKI